MRFRKPYANTPALVKFVLSRLHEETSPISGKIEVIEDGVERKLLIEGATQSIYRTDGTERGYWLGLIPEQEVRSALILGLGGGTAVRLLRKRWPGVRVVAYELDPAVVRAATSFMNLDQGAEVRIADFREALRDPEKFDCIIVDLYRGHKFIPEAESESFLKELRVKLHPGGLVAFNRIPAFGRQELDQFEDRLCGIFSKVWTAQADLNLVYWGQA